MNLLPRTQGRGFGQQLFALWCDAALQRGVQAMHVGINRANGGAARFWSRLGFQPLSLDGLPEGRTLWMGRDRSEEQTSELQSLMRISYAVFCLKKKN